MQPQGDAPQEWRGLRQHPVSSPSAHHTAATNPPCASLFLPLKTSLHSAQHCHVYQSLAVRNGLQYLFMGMHWALQSR